MRPELSQEQIDYFLTGVDFAFFWDEPERERDWQAAREEILADWIREHPGTRPAAWWAYDAPKQAAPRVPKWRRPEMVEPRQRIGGTGAPSWEKYPATLPYFRFGIPIYWDGINREDPPVFESEAAYLRRHKLFLPGEEKRLSETDYKPEVIS